jgi:hypothetical protein
LQASLGEFAGFVAYAEVAGREFQSRHNSINVGGVVSLRLIAPQQAHIAQPREIPGVEELCAAMIMNMLMIAVYQGHGPGQPPIGIEIVINRKNCVPIDRFFFVVVPGDLTYGNIPFPGAGLILGNIFEAQVDAGTALG